MKIPVNSFGLDMNTLLNELNGNNIHGYYNKVINNTKQKTQQITANINKQIEQGHNDSRQTASELQQKIQELQDANENMWNHEIPDKLRSAMDKTLTQVPTSTVYYYPPGQYPSDPQPGDIVWQIPDPSQFGSNHIEAKAYRYEKDGGWQLLKNANQDVFGADIIGANIKGGEITGAEFRSNSQGADNETPFWVNAEGQLYARNFLSDLYHPTAGGINPYVYEGRLASDEGFAIVDGMIIMNAFASQKSGTPIWEDWPNVNGTTMLEPGYLKLRYDRGGNRITRTSGDTDEIDDNFVRTDLRAGLLEIGGNSWSQKTGIKLGYWNAGNGDTPKLSFGRWTIGENNADLRINGPANISTYQPIHAHGGIEADSLIVKGGFQVNNKTWADKSDINALANRISSNEAKTDNNSGKIYDHGQILDGNDFIDPNNIINGNLNPNNHEDRLNSHQQSIGTLNSQMTTVMNNTDTFNSWLSNNGVNFEGLNFQNGAIWGSGANNGDAVYFWAHTGGYNVPIPISCGDIRLWGSIHNESSLSVKKDITNVDPKKAFMQILNMNVNSWHYKNEDPDSQKHIGPIIDNIHSIKNSKYYTPNNLVSMKNNNGSVILTNEISYLVLSVQELEKQNSQLTQRVAKLEFENKGSN